MMHSIFIFCYRSVKLSYFAFFHCRHRQTTYCGLFILKEETSLKMVLYAVNCGVVLYSANFLSSLSLFSCVLCCAWVSLLNAFWCSNPIRPTSTGHTFASQHLYMLDRNRHRHLQIHLPSFHDSLQWPLHIRCKSP